MTVTACPARGPLKINEFKLYGMLEIIFQILVQVLSGKKLNDILFINLMYPYISFFFFFLCQKKSKPKRVDPNVLPVFS